MDVSFLSTSGSHCGIASYTANLRAGLNSCGVQTEIEPIDRQPLSYLSRAELSEHFLRLAQRMRAANVVHLQHEFGPFGGAYGYGVSTSTLRTVVTELARLGKPTVVTLHTDPFGMFGRRERAPILAHNAYLKALWRIRVATLFRTTGLQAIVHTRVSRRATIDSGVPRERVEVIRHGLPAPRRRSVSGEERDAIRLRLGYTPEQKVLAIFGFLETYKGYRTAIRSLSHLPADYQLAIVGGNNPFSQSPAHEVILAELERYPAVRERVSVRGFVPSAELSDYQHAADMCLAPYQRGTPLSSSGGITWALSSGKPVIASALPAFSELSDYSDCLELVTPDAPRELALAVQRLGNDTERGRQLVFNADRYCERHSWDATAAEHIRLYDEVSRRRAPHAARVAGLSPKRVSERVARGVARAVETRRRPAATVDADGLVEVPLQVAGSRITFCLDPQHSHDPLISSLIEGSYPDDPQLSLMQRLIRPGDVVVDLGAHVGTYSLAAAARGCRVVAIDADPAHVKQLQRSVTQNGFTNVTVVHAAASDHVGTARFVPNAVWGHVAGNWGQVTAGNGSEAAPGSIEVPAMPVSRILDDLGLGRVDFVKLDIEGSELAAIAGMLSLLSADEAPALLFESNAATLPHVSGSTYHDLQHRIEELGYRLYMVDLERPGRLVPVRAGDPMPHSVLDYLAVKRLPELFPWYVGEPFTHTELARRVVRASELDDAGYRAYAASLICSGPDWLRRDPRIEEALSRLRADESPAVRAAVSSAT